MEFAIGFNDISDREFLEPLISHLQTLLCGVRLVENIESNIGFYILTRNTNMIFDIINKDTFIQFKEKYKNVIVISFVDVKQYKASSELIYNDDDELKSWYKTIGSFSFTYYRNVPVIYKPTESHIKNILNLIEKWGY